MRAGSDLELEGALAEGLTVHVHASGLQLVQGHGCCGVLGSKCWEEG